MTLLTAFLPPQNPFRNWTALTLPERVCLVLEALSAATDLDGFGSAGLTASMVYRFTHIATGYCRHDDWMEEFEAAERDARISYYTSPLELRCADQLLERGLIAAHHERKPHVH